MTSRLPDHCQELLGHQHGIIARWQTAQARLDASGIDERLRRRRWQRLYSGVYASFTGEPSRTAVLWAAVLRAGPDALLSHWTAAELDLLAEAAGAVHVTIPTGQRIRVPAQECSPPLPVIIVHRSARAGQARHPARIPPRTRVEETVIDLTQAASSLDEAMSWLIRGCARRLTTPPLLAAAMTARARIRWRSELSSALADISEGAQSALELRYVRRVERPHGLPRARRQAPSKVAGRSRYLDNHYREFGVAVELDGRVAHPAEARWRDIHRDNASATMGLITLRYGWADVTTYPCLVAAQIGEVLRQRGWTGRLRACAPACNVVRS
jgi:very-short-patch-repair endonuclease